MRGPSLPSRCRIRVANSTCSQSSMNSHKWDRPAHTHTHTHVQSSIDEDSGKSGSGTSDARGTPTEAGLVHT